MHTRNGERGLRGRPGLLLGARARAGGARGLRVRGLLAHRRVQPRHRPHQGAGMTAPRPTAGWAAASLLERHVDAGGLPRGRRRLGARIVSRSRDAWTRRAGARAQAAASRQRSSRCGPARAFAHCWNGREAALSSRAVVGHCRSGRERRGEYKSAHSGATDPLGLHAVALWHRCPPPIPDDRVAGHGRPSPPAASGLHSYVTSGQRVPSGESMAGGAPSSASLRNARCDVAGRPAGSVRNAGDEVVP